MDAATVSDTVEKCLYRKSVIDEMSQAPLLNCGSYKIPLSS